MAAIHIAAEKGNSDILEMLLEYQGIDVNIKFVFYHKVFLFR